MDRYVCGECFEDEDVKEFIAGNAVSKRCSYCDREADQENCAEIANVAQFIQDGLESEYDQAVNCLPYESREGGYQGVTYETYELLKDYAELGFESEDLLQDLLGLLPDDLWCDQDPFQLPPDEELRFDWGRFSELVKHEMRHVFYQVGRKKKDWGAPGKLVQFT